MKVKLQATRIIEISGEFIKLDSLLKLAGVAQTGGEAKIYIAESEVTVDGEVATERGRKLRDGSVVKIFGQTMKIKALSATEKVTAEKSIEPSNPAKPKLPLSTQPPKKAKNTGATSNAKPKNQQNKKKR